MTITIHAAAPAVAIAPARPRYDGLSIAFHWITVLLVLAQSAGAFLIDQAPPELVGLVLQAHRSTGVVLWVLVAARLVWRFTGMRLPPFPPAMRRWHVLGVHLSEYGMYALLLVQPLTGMADTLWRGRAFPLFGTQVPKLLAKNRDLAADAHLLHMAGAWALAAVVGVHACAALFHHLVLKDGVLASMLPWARKRG